LKHAPDCLRCLGQNRVLVPWAAVEGASPEQADDFGLLLLHSDLLLHPVPLAALGQHGDQPDELTVDVEDWSPRDVSEHLSSISTGETELPGLTFLSEEPGVEAHRLWARVRWREEFEAVLTDQLRDLPAKEPLSGTVEILQLAGYPVSETADPEDALARLAAGGVSLLILDLGLPVHGSPDPVRPGLDLLKRVAELPPVIVVSGSGRPPPMDAPTSVFLGKPVAPQRLLAEVGRILGEARS
jgi:hypothetical protein